MIDRPILFSAPMVRAILDGRKTQTRRVFKVQPIPVDLSSEQQEDAELRGLRVDAQADGRFIVTKPRFAIGDRLWVRETWAHVPLKGGHMGAIYRADGEDAEDEIEESWSFLGKWRVSIHMPRQFSRLTLTVTDVRVQRLQDISEEDAKAEGIDPYEAATRAPTGALRNLSHTGYRLPFTDLWNKINGIDAWDANPWVVALTFTVERRNIDAPAAALDAPGGRDGG